MACCCFCRYIPVDEESQRQLFYYLVTHEGPASPRDDTPLGGVSAPPRDDTPLIIWLTGGPGCSSMDAFTYENGPFKFTAPGRLKLSIQAVIIPQAEANVRSGRMRHTTIIATNNTNTTC